MALNRPKFAASKQVRKSQASLRFEPLEPRMMLASDLYITEFSASNDSTLDDGDGNSSDWIEVFNSSSSAINLGDYYLTDDATDLTKWNLPTTTLEGGEFLVVFASGQATDNYTDAGGNYHTNFKLSKGGEYLASVYEDPNNSDLTVVNEFAPEFPGQFTDISYGLAMFGGGGVNPALVNVETDIAPFSPFVGDPYTPTFTSGGPSSTDLLHGLLPSSSEGDFSRSGSGGLPVLTDGNFDTFYGDGSESNFHDAYAAAGDDGTSGTTVTYDLGGSFDLGEIVIYGGWVDGGRDEQSYEVFVSTNNGSSYSSLGTGSSNPGENSRPASSRISFQSGSSSYLATSATNIRVDFLGTENGWSGYAEIDVFEATAGEAGSVLVDDNTLMTYFVPTDGSLGATWTQTGFDDSAWSDLTNIPGPNFGQPAAAGIGYENSPGSTTNYTNELKVLTSTDPVATTTSAYTRFEFDIASPESIATLSLQMIYDDGFVAYLNGVQIAEDNAPPSPAWNSTAVLDPGEEQRGDAEILSAYINFDITQHIDDLVQGTNVLSIHALNLNSSSDMLMIPRLLASATPGIVMPLEAGYFSKASPGAVNNEVFQGFVEDTKFSVDRGFYSSPVSLAITTDTAGATIVYTTDGSVPTVDENLVVTNGTLYTGEININSTTNIRAVAFKADFAPTNVDTHTYVFLDDVLQQTAASQEAALEQGLPSNAGNGVDFGIDSDILNSFSNQEVKDSLLSLPTISLTMENSDFLGTNGIYTNSTDKGKASERPVSAELIHPDGTPGFQINAGVRIQGAASRSFAEKYSFRLAFRGEYGPTDLVYPLFGDGVDKFDTVVLRSVFNDGYGWSGDDGNLREQQYIRDYWFRETQIAMGQPAARSNWTHLYVNGQYWGLYHPTERPDSNFAQETLGGDNDDYDAYNHDGVVDDASENDPNNNVGASAVYNTARGLVNDVVSASGTTNKNTAYQKLQGNFSDGTNDPNQEDYLDVENYIDYMIANIFGGNDDWPTNNWYANRLRGDDSEGLRYFSWDSEISLSLSTRTNVLENYTGVSTGAAEFYATLRNYEEFRVQFGDQIHKHMFNDGALAGDNPADRYEALALPIREAIIGESARWGDQHFSNNPVTQAEWDAELARMLDGGDGPGGTLGYFQERPGIALAQFVAANLYPDTDAPEFLVDAVAQHGGAIPSGASLGFDNPGGQGAIYYTTDGTDPRLVGGDLNIATAIQFTSNLSLTETTNIKARVLHNGNWSALTEASFVINPTITGNLVITELNYNPYDALTQYGDLDLDNDQFEFIELRNVSGQAIDLAGVELVEAGDDGVSFVFTAQVLNPNEYVLVVKNEAAFESRYGFGLNVAGEYGGSLGNSGDTITLIDASSASIQTFEYDDSGNWPGRADGTGSSLEIVDTSGDYDSDDNWRSSSEFGGSPGTLGAGPVQDVIVNEVLSHSDGISLDLIELYNTSGIAIDLEQWYLSDSKNNLFKYQFTSSTMLGSGQYHVLSEAQFGFGIDGQLGEDVWLIEADAVTGKPLRFADHVEFDATDTDVSLGRWNNGDPSSDLFPMTSPTFGTANSGPVFGDVLISEVNYNPAAVPPAEVGNIDQNELEFVELTNTTNAPVDISNWKVDGIDFTFPETTVLSANEVIVLVRFNPVLEPAKATAFRNVFGIGSGPRLFGDASGKLNNSGERVKLLRPEDPITFSTGDVLVDAVRYDELAPWPTSANGGGNSLHRTAANAYGGFFASWLAAPGTPGSAILTNIPSGNFDGDSDIDGSDFLAWQRGFGITGVATPQDGDADGDQDVDAADLDVWVSQYGSAPSLQAITAVADEQPVALAAQVDAAAYPTEQPMESVVASPGFASIAALFSHSTNEGLAADGAFDSELDETVSDDSANESVVDYYAIHSPDTPASHDEALRSLYEDSSSNRHENDDWIEYTVQRVLHSGLKSDL